MLTPADTVWLRDVLPGLLGVPSSAASMMVEMCKGHATNPFSPEETLFNEHGPRAKFWAELGRCVGEHLHQDWSNRDLTMEEAVYCAGLLSEHLMEAMHQAQRTGPPKSLGAAPPAAEVARPESASPAASGAP